MDETSLKGPRSNRILFFWGVVLLLFLVGFSYHKYVFLKDYTLYAQVSCEPESEDCFVYECNPSDDESCLEDEPYTYFKVVYMPASYAPTCDALTGQGCEELTCDTSKYCEEITCNDTTMADYQEGTECG